MLRKFDAPLLAEPSALLYSTIANAPSLSFDDQLNSTRHYMRELNRFGVTSVSDVSRLNYPGIMVSSTSWNEDGHLTLRIAYSLFAGGQPGQSWRTISPRQLGMTKPSKWEDMLA